MSCVRACVRAKLRGRVREVLLNAGGLDGKVSSGAGFAGLGFDAIREGFKEIYQILLVYARVLRIRIA